jgi:hypothetical protein
LKPIAGKADRDEREHRAGHGRGHEHAAGRDQQRDRYPHLLCAGSAAPAWRTCTSQAIEIIHGIELNMPTWKSLKWPILLMMLGSQKVAP